MGFQMLHKSMSDDAEHHGRLFSDCGSVVYKPKIRLGGANLAVLE